MSLDSRLAERELIEISWDPERYQKRVETAKRDLERSIMLNKKKRLAGYSYKPLANWQEEISASARDVHEDPFSAERHARFAKALARIGIFGGATLHLRQALALDPGCQTYDAHLRSLLESPHYQEKSEIYFLSISDDAPPFRALRQTGEYNRKKEPAFPVYSRAGNRASVMIDAAD